MSAITVTPQDRAAGFKEITVLMESGRRESIRVYPMTVHKMVLLDKAGMNTHSMYEFIATAIQRNIPAVLKIHPQSYQDILIVTTGLMAEGYENIARQAVIDVGHGVVERAMEAAR